MATASIQERTAKDGSTTFRIRWDRGVDPATGRRRQGSETVVDSATGRTLRVPPDADPDAKRGPWPTARVKVNARRAAILAGDELPDAGRITVVQYLRHWLEITSGSRLAATHYLYARDVERHIVPALGAMRLVKLTALHVEQFLAAKRRDGYGDSTVHNIQMVLDMALAQAVRWRIIAANPCDSLVRAGRRARTVSPSQVWTGAELRAFLASAATDDRYGALWRVLAATGMRVGEVMALRWDAIDWDGGAIAVTRTVSRSASGATIDRDGTKTGRSRTVAVDGLTLQSLRDHRQRQRIRRAASPAWEDPRLVFTNRAGGILINSTVRYAFRAASADAGVPLIRVHDLRHTHATVLLLAGVHPKVVSERLGHATIAITLDLYSHVVPGLQEPAVNAISGVLDGPLRGVS